VLRGDKNNATLDIATDTPEDGPDFYCVEIGQGDPGAFNPRLY